ncbi:MAG: histidinol-phosphate transaminase [Pseudomonadota bacterium]
MARVRAISEADPDSVRSDGPAPNSWLSEIAPYVGGAGRLNGAERVLKLSANENPMGPSPRATDAYRRAGDSLGAYPDGSASALRGAIASVHGIDPDRIVCGAGSDELIALLCQAYLAPGDEAVHSEFGFAMYRISTLAAGGRPVVAPETALTADVDALLAAVTPRTRLMFLANPNNPTGSYLPESEIRRLIAALPSRVLLVLDGAYAEYMREPDFIDGLKLVEDTDRLVCTRTFSKIHGLAALRLGWCYAPSRVVDTLNRVRGPFNVSAPAIAAGEAAIRDVDYAEACAIQNEVWREWLANELRRAGIETPRSWGNFLLPFFGQSGPTSASAADAFLRANGVIVRRMDSYGLPGHLRITVGASSDNVAVARALSEFMSEAELGKSLPGGASARP